MKECAREDELGTLSAAYFGATTVDELGDTLTLLRLPPGVAFVLTGGLRYAPALAASWAGLLDARLLLPAVVRALRTADAMGRRRWNRAASARNARPS